MKTSAYRVVVFLKSGIKQIRSFVKEHKKTIAKYFGKIVLIAAKTIIEEIFKDLL